MFPPKKKPGLAVGIMIGKPKPGSDLDSPDPVEGKAAPAHEAAEPPAHEQQEEYGAKLVQDIESAGEKYGLDAETSHAVAADFFDAVAKCLRGGSGESAPAGQDTDSGGMGMGGMQGGQ